MSNIAVFGVYRDSVGLSGGLEAFRAAGFRNTDISVLLPENAGTKDFVHQKDTKAPEGATAGVTTGAVLAASSVGWRASEHWRSQESGRSSPRAPSLHCWPARARLAQLAEL